MTLQDYLRVIRERWKIVALAALLGALGAVMAFLVRPAEYTAQVSLYVSAQVGDNPQQAYQGAQLSEQRVKSYTELVTSERVLSETIRRMGLSQSTGQLASHVSTTSATDSVIINIEATERSGESAAAIANNIGNVTTEVVADLERPASPNGIPPVAVRMVQPASVPSQPSSTGLPTILALGLLAGIAVGIAAAFVRNALDSSIKSIARLSELTGCPNLGYVPFDSAVTDKPLAEYGDPHSKRAEAIRRLRTNLQFIRVDSPCKVVMITSSVPAEGKTTTAANLAMAFSATTDRALLIDADMRRPRLAEVLGIDAAVGLSQVLAGQVPLSRAIQVWGGGAFDLLPSGRTPPNPSELLSSDQMVAVLGELKTRYDVIIIDSPPLLPVTDSAALAPATDGAILVCRFRSTTQAQIEAARRALQAVSMEPLATVMTMVPDSGPFSYGAYNSYYGQSQPEMERKRDGQVRNVTPRPPSHSDRRQSGNESGPTAEQTTRIKRRPNA